MQRILKIILFLSILMSAAPFNWSRFTGKILTELESQPKSYKLRILSHINGSIATFKGKLNSFLFYNIGQSNFFF